MRQNLPPTWKQKLLGLFVLMQFAAVFISNVAGFISPQPDSTTGELPPAPGKPAEYLRFAADRYCEATGQPQGWGMFDAGLMRNSVGLYVVVKFRDGGQEMIGDLASRVNQYDGLRLPASRSRQFVFESAFLGQALVGIPPDHRDNTDFLAASQNEVIINHAAYESLLNGILSRWLSPPDGSHISHKSRLIEEAVLFIHWQPTEPPNGWQGSQEQADKRIVARLRPGHGVEAFVGSTKP